MIGCCCKNHLIVWNVMSEDSCKESQISPDEILAVGMNLLALPILDSLYTTYYGVF